MLLITIDTLRADAVGFMGSSRVSTPALDRLASAGTVFERAHAHNTLTLPSHANILTGLLAYQHGIRSNAGYELEASHPTLAASLREAGFATAAVIAAYPLKARYGLDRGFDLYDDDVGTLNRREFRTPQRSGAEVISRGLEWWSKHEGERRFLWLHLFEPHAPYSPPEPFASRYAGEPYLGEVATLDSYLQPLIERVLSDDPSELLLVLTSDHGEGLGDHGEPTHGLLAYDSTLRVPLVLYGGAIPSARVAVAAAHVDIVPTVLEAVGLEVPDGLPGRSLLSAGDEAPRVHYFEALEGYLTRGWAPLRGVIRAEHKLISLPLPELYDLIVDPQEVDNLHRERADLAAEILALLPPEALQVEPPRALGDEERRALEALGYVVSGEGAEERRPESYGVEDDPKRRMVYERKMHRFIELYDAGRLEEATTTARELVAEQPQMEAAHFYLAQALLDLGETAEALQAMERARSRGVASETLERQLGLTLAELGRAEEALEILSALDGDEPENLNAYGLALADAGDLPLAEQTLNRALELEPDNARVLENLARLEVLRQQWGAGEARARAALEIDEGLPLAWNYLGIALYRTGRTLEALAAWERAVELDPADLDVLFNLATVALEAQETAIARRALEQFIVSASPERHAADIVRARQLLDALER